MSEENHNHSNERMLFHGQWAIHPSAVDATIDAAVDATIDTLVDATAEAVL